MKEYPKVTPEVLARLGVKVKEKPNPTTEEEMETARHEMREHTRRRKRINITLDPRALSIARRIGNGNASRGIDLAIFHFDMCDQAPRLKHSGPHSGARDVRRMAGNPKVTEFLKRKRKFARG